MMRAVLLSILLAALSTGCVDQTAAALRREKVYAIHEVRDLHAEQRKISALYGKYVDQLVQMAAERRRSDDSAQAALLADKAAALNSFRETLVAQLGAIGDQPIAGDRIFHVHSDSGPYVFYVLVRNGAVLRKSDPMLQME